MESWLRVNNTGYTAFLEVSVQFLATMRWLTYIIGSDDVFWVECIHADKVLIYIKFISK